MGQTAGAATHWHCAAVLTPVCPLLVDSLSPARIFGFLSVKVTGLAQKLGQLEAVNRELQSKILGQLATFGPTL